MAALVLTLLLSPVLGADPLFDLFIKQANRTATSFAPTKYPIDTTMNVPVSTFNPWNTAASGDWRCGFFPGELWYLYNLTGDTYWKNQAANWTAGIANQQYNTGTHDVGFMVFNSFGKGYEFTQDPSYKTVILNTAKSLSTRFNPTVGCTQSWGAGYPCKYDPTVYCQFPVIIDNMMNIELLFWASQNGGDPNYYNMAVSHADTTAKNHVRSDGSTFHVVDYNPSNGDVVIKCTAQGYADNSTWARGQSWCVYGYTMTYRYTKESRHLTTAINCANVFIAHLQSDNVTLWDFDYPGETGLHYRDSSAAAVAASGLAELSRYVNSSTATIYKTAALNMVHALNTTNYQGLYNATEGIVLHGTGCFECNSEVDVSLIYGDYYLLEAYRRLTYGWI